MGYAGDRKKLLDKWGVQSAEEARSALENFRSLRDHLDALLTQRNIKDLP